MHGSTSHPAELGLGDARHTRPFVKWAGGKRRLAAELTRLAPPDFRRYLEPFVGGGALFFHLHNLGRVAHGAVLSDLNAELMTCYQVVQDETTLAKLIRLLRRHARHVLDADYYYRVRALDRKASFLESNAPVERAARAIFLNHTCYNGLYRLNSKGQFNVPYGKWRRPPSLCDEANLWACHRALQGVDLHQESFEKCPERARKDDFVYLDPPYVPLSPTSSFTTYTGTEFREEHQRRLAGLFRQLDERGCLVMLSNSAAPLIHSLYRGFRFETVLARRAINCKPGGRGEIEELVVMNYR